MTTATLKKIPKKSLIIKLNPKIESSEKSCDKTHSPSDGLIFPKTKDLLTRIGVYSANYFHELFSNLYEAKTSIGNAYGAIGFATLDVLARKNSKFKRLTKFGGNLWYIGEGVYDLTLALTDQENVLAHLGNFALDVSMAWQLGKDAGSLYKELEVSGKKEIKFGISKDLEEIVKFFKEKFKSEQKKESFEAGVSDKKTKLKGYLSVFGKGIAYGTSAGISAGYSFGKSAFEKLKENYSVYKTKRKESNKLKEIENEKIKNKRAEEKIKNAGFDEFSFKKKKEILEYSGKNPDFMKDYEINNEHTKFKQKPIREQIQIMTERKDSLKKDLEQMENASWSKRFKNYSKISYAKSTIKKLDKILFELGIEEKNPPRSSAIDNWLKKQENKGNEE